MPTPNHSSWRPLFSVAESAPYREAVDAVAAELERPSRDVFVFSRHTATANHAGTVPGYRGQDHINGLSAIFRFLLHLHSPLAIR